MREQTEMIRLKAEWLYWSARKEANRLRLDGLRDKLLLEQQDVERMEKRGLFTYLKHLGRYESSLEKEVEEAEAAQAELQNIEDILKEADRMLSRLGRGAAEAKKIELDKAVLTKDEEELLSWVEEMELAWKTVAENSACMECAGEMLQELRDGMLDIDRLPAFGERVNDLYRMTGDFLRSMGAVSIVPGIKTRNWRRTYYVNGGKTVLFQQEGKPVREVKAHSFDYQNMKSKVAVEEALIWTIMDLENNKLLFVELVEEKIAAFPREKK